MRLNATVHDLLLPMCVHACVAPDGPLVIRLKSLAALSSPATSPRTSRHRFSSSQHAQHDAAGGAAEADTVLKQWIQSRLGPAVRIVLSRQVLERDVAAVGYGYMHWKAFRDDMTRLGAEVRQHTHMMIRCTLLMHQASNVCNRIFLKAWSECREVQAHVKAAFWQLTATGRVVCCSPYVEFICWTVTTIVSRTTCPPLHDSTSYHLGVSLQV